MLFFILHFYLWDFEAVFGLAESKTYFVRITALLTLKNFFCVSQRPATFKRNRVCAFYCKGNRGRRCRLLLSVAFHLRCFTFLNIELSTFFSFHFSSFKIQILQIYNAQHFLLFLYIVQWLNQASLCIILQINVYSENTSSFKPIFQTTGTPQQFFNFLVLSE